MLKDEKIHFLATDMHNTKARKPSTQGAEVWMAKHLDSIYMKKLCYKNALKLIKQNTQRRENDKYGKQQTLVKIELKVNMKWKLI